MSGRLLLVLVLCSSSYVLTLKPKDCQLYSVFPGENPEFDLTPGVKTLMTFNTSDTATTTVEMGGTCLLEVQRAPSKTCEVVPEQCFVSVMILVRDERVWVYEVGGERWVEVNITNPTLTNTIKIITNGYRQVAFNCPEGCFQFTNATISKYIGGGKEGSLVFYGRATEHSDSLTQFGNVVLIYGERGVIRKNIDLDKSNHNLTEWTKFTINVTFGNISTILACNTVYPFEKLELNVGKESNSRPIFPNGSNINAACSMNPVLKLNFNSTTSLEWSICRPPNDSTISKRPTTTTTPTPISSSSSSPSSPPTTRELADKEPPFCQLLTWVLGVAVGVLVLVLVALSLALLIIRCEGHKKKKRESEVELPMDYPQQQQHPQPQHHAEGEDDPANHVYDYMDLSAFQAEKRREEEDTGKINEVTKRNSLYGCVMNRQEDEEEAGKINEVTQRNSLYGYVVNRGEEEVD